jgi:type VII secretion integral membrane protein EccD
MNVMTDTGTRAVTICRGTRRVDVRLPAEVPVAELMPGLLDLAEGDRRSDGPAVAGSPRTWGLVPVGRPPLDWGHSLADAGVANGDVLILTEETTAATGAAIYDVADLAAARIELTGPSFGRQHALVAWPGFAALAALAVGVVALAGVELRPWSLTAVAAALAVALVVFRRQPLPAVGAAELSAHAVAVAAIGCAVAATVGWLDGRPATTVAAVAGGVATVFGAAIWSGTEQRLVGAFAVVCGLASCLAAGVDAAALTQTQVALTVGALAFVAVGAAPRLAVTTGGMGGLDLLIRSGGSPDDDTVTTAVARSNRIVTGLLSGCAVVTAASAIVLGAGSPWAIVVAGLLVAGLLVRVQSFTRPAHRLVVLVPTLVAAALIPAVAGVSHDVLAIVVVALPLAVYAGLRVSWPRHLLARLRLGLGWGEVAVVVALGPAIAAAAGLFGWLSGGLS